VVVHGSCDLVTLAFRRHNLPIDLMSFADFFPEF